MGRRKKIIKKVGERVTIYYDPFRNIGIEGNAHLLKLYKKDKETDIWWCLFEDGFKAKRRIKHEYHPYKYKNLEGGL